jgi:hypothetical protein
MYVCTRQSVLADIASTPEHNLSKIVCKNPNVEAQQVPPESDVQFQVQILSVSGIPSETESRVHDVVHRGVRFCICRTDKPPTAEEVGMPPEFLGNVTSLHASPDMTYKDVWYFNNKVGCLRNIQESSCDNDVMQYDDFDS